MNAGTGGDYEVAVHIGHHGNLDGGSRADDDRNDSAVNDCLDRPYLLRCSPVRFAVISLTHCGFISAHVGLTLTHFASFRVTWRSLWLTPGVFAAAPRFDQFRQWWHLKKHGRPKMPKCPEEFIMAMALAGFEPSFRALGHATKQVGRRGTHPTKIRVPVQQIDGWGRLTKWGAFNR